MALSDTSNPAIGTLSLRVRPATPGADPVVFDRFLEYDYAEEYLSPSDSFYFDVDEKELSPTDAAALAPGSVVQVLNGGNVQSVGIIDDVEANVDRGAGSVVHVTCRDQMSLAVDAQLDPRQRFTPSMTLADVLVACYGPLGFTDFQIDNAANRNIITGQVYGTATSATGSGKRASPQGAKALKNFVLHQEKPYPNEGVFAFTSRVSQRFGLWIRPGATAGQLIVAKPDFDQQPRYGIQHALTAPGNLSNNIERGTFRKSRQEQPSILYASGFGGGGDFPKSKLKAGIVNPVVDSDNSAIIDAYPDVKLLEVPAVSAAFPPLIEAKARPAFLYDPESHSTEQLNAYLQRELSLRMRKALTARYQIMGHVLNGQSIAVDTIVNVNDQRPTVRWAGNLWVIARRFSKNAREGTRTTIECILPGALAF